MGNRAVIACSDKPDAVGIYVHWNGGIESVEGFLAACKQLNYRDPTVDESYGMARLCAAICAFMGLDGDSSVGIGPLSKLDCDNMDNGLYILGPNWTIEKRKYFKGREKAKASDVEAIKDATIAAVGDAYARRTEEIRKVIAGTRKEA